MNKLKYLFISIIGLIILSPGVKAEEIETICDYSINSTYQELGKENIISITNELYTYYKNNYKDENPYYAIQFYGNTAYLYAYNTLPTQQSYMTSQVDSSNGNKNFLLHYYKYSSIVGGVISIEFNYYNGTLDKTNIITNPSYADPRILQIVYTSSKEFLSCSITPVFYSNFDINFIGNDELEDYTSSIYFQESINSTNYEVLDFNSTYKFKNYSDLLDYNFTNQFLEVNLDNYHYVLLSLKDYSQTEAFESNLKVKGMIGITPIYNFGTTEKTTITDRCNISYSDYTDYRLYVLKDDLINNAIYAVKSCEEASSFKFDNSIFNITYITDDNVDDPVVVVDGQEYHTIPFDDLSNSANKNEENNFIPGESDSSFSDIIDNAISFTSDIWNAFLSFMSLGTKFFNALPPEFRALSITGFTVLITIAVIKFLKS